MRSGHRVFGTSWHHDCAAAPGGGFRFGNCFVVVGLVVRIAALGERAWCLPLLFRLWRPTPRATKADPEPQRRPSQQDLAAMLLEIAAAAKRSEWRQISVAGRGEVKALVVNGLWYSVFGSRAVQVVIVREPADADGYRIALVSTDAEATAAEIVARYADRWSIEVAFQDAKHVVGVGEARNRVRQAVERTVPCGLPCHASRSRSPGTRFTPTQPLTSPADGGSRPGTPRSETPRCST